MMALYLTPLSGFGEVRQYLMESHVLAKQWLSRLEALFCGCQYLCVLFGVIVQIISRCTKLRNYKFVIIVYDTIQMTTFSMDIYCKGFHP